LELFLTKIMVSLYDRQDFSEKNCLNCFLLHAKEPLVNVHICFPSKKQLKENQPKTNVLLVLWKVLYLTYKKIVADDREP
jgi:hypothetical protein